MGQERAGGEIDSLNKVGPRSGGGERICADVEVRPQRDCLRGRLEDLHHGNSNC